MQLEIGETRRFRLDRSFHRLKDDAYDRIIALLRDDPIIGVQRPDSPALWDWEIGGHRLTYSISDDLTKLVLLRYDPIPAPRGRIGANIMKWIRIINDIKRLFGV